MKQRIFATVFLGIAVSPSCVLPCALMAQSAPPGQVSHRMAMAPPSAKDTITPLLSADQLATVPAARPAEKLTLKMTAPGVTTPIATSVDPCKDQINNTPEMDRCQATNALGSAKQAAWNAVLAIDNQAPAASGRKLLAARNFAANFKDTTDLPAAEDLVARQERTLRAAQTQDADVLAAMAEIKSAIKSLRCSTTVLPNDDPNAKPQFGYGYRVLLPTFGKSCSGDAIQNFFHAGPGVFEAANQVKYLYNAQQSASQFSADLLTATFPGFQAVIAGTATAGSSQPTSTAGTTGAITRVVHSFAAAATNTSAASTDSVATAVAKIQSGGDFNVRFPVPLLYYSSGSYSISSGTHPNIGFNIDQFSGQSTITESTEYGVNVPWETYMQTKSLDSDANGNANAVLFLDLQPSAEVISPALASKIGLVGSRYFFLGQAAAGIQFSNSIGISFQYLYGPKQAFASTDTSATPSITNSRIQGFHLAISFSPQKKSKS